VSTYVKLTLERMVRAFLCAACGTLAIGINNTQLTQPGIKALVVGAIASGVSACITLVSGLFGPDPSSTSFTNTIVSSPANPEGNGK
jgi:hypothetical protein